MRVTFDWKADITGIRSLVMPPWQFLLRGVRVYKCSYLLTYLLTYLTDFLVNILSWGYLDTTTRNGYIAVSSVCLSVNTPPTIGFNFIQLDVASCTVSPGHPC